MKTHSYTGDSFPDLDRGWYKCEFCDFTSKTVETMEVHVGNCQTEDFECGLCEFCTNSLENLELHLKSCEIYECGICGLRSRFLKEMKTLIEAEHKGPIETTL